MALSYVKKLAQLVESEYDTYHGYDETTSKMSGRIKKYWVEIGYDFPGVSTAWSAVFVSYFVKMAGATKEEFNFNQAHSQFVYTAAKNTKNNTGVFRAHSPSDYAPKIGDIIQNNRDGNTYDFNFAKANKKYYSHSSIVVEEGNDGSGKYVRTVGGNESDTVGDKVVRVTSAGLIKQPSSTPKYYISVIQDLK